ncbi:MAG: hypothetical protein JXN60_06250, partial [Lentisphaerae bacterium]|nr:hypothetical protein [Lentisphaerota bacterium]
SYGMQVDRTKLSITIFTTHQTWNTGVPSRLSSGSAPSRLTDRLRMAEQIPPRRLQRVLEVLNESSAEH